MKESVLMFKNIGKKIKVLAKVLCWIGIVCSVLIGLAIILLSFMATVEVPGTEVSVSGVGGLIAGIVFSSPGSAASPPTVSAS